MVIFTMFWLIGDVFVPRIVLHIFWQYWPRWMIRHEQIWRRRSRNPIKFAKWRNFQKSSITLGKMRFMFERKKTEFKKL
jgi:hypothetical protein